MSRSLCLWIVRGAALVAMMAALRAGFAQPLPAGVDDCVARIEQQRTDAATERGAASLDGARDAPSLADLCPELAAAIDEGAWGAALDVPSAENLSLAAFAALTEVVAGYERPANGDVDLSPASLDQALEELRLREQPLELSIWDRIQQWYEEHFGTQRDATRSWLERWLEGVSFPERVIRYLVIALGALVVVATALIVWNELRVAGVLAGGVLRKYSPLSAGTAEDEPRASDFDDVLRAPLGRRPALLLALVLERLRARTQQPLRDSLTHRELLGAATGLSAEQSDAFRFVVGAAERTTFGRWQPDEPACDGLLERGRALLGSLADDDASQRSRRDRPTAP